MTTNDGIKFEPGTVLVAGTQLRPIPFAGRNSRGDGPDMHATARHGGAPWLPEHDAERAKEEARLFRKFGRHRLPFVAKSTFHSASLIPELLRMSAQHPGLVGFGGKNVIVMFDAGYEVGYDAQARQLTSLVTVIAKFTGELETVFPGRLMSDQIPLPIVAR